MLIYVTDAAELKLCLLLRVFWWPDYSTHALDGVKGKRIALSAVDRFVRILWLFACA